MAVMLRWVVFLVCTFLLNLTGVYAANNTNTTGTTDVTRVRLSDKTAFAVCLYPASGSYSFLTRLLYYCTLVFSLFSRAHLWLVAGALASAMTYSGVAAVHACLIAWVGPNPQEEQDVWVLSTILGTASLITVPLLNWSGTLRRLGAKFGNANDKNALKTQSHAGTRTIVVYWAFLVLVGYLSVWKAIHFSDGDSNHYPDMSRVFCRPGTNASLFHSADGSSHRRAIDSDFVVANECNNPCDLISAPSIFKQNSDLVLLDHKKALVWNETLQAPKYHRLHTILKVQGQFDNTNEYMIVFILLQGALTVCFGRRDPREIRDFIYIKLAMDHPWSDKSAVLAIQDWISRILAFLSYLMAVLTVLICPPLFILLIFDQEWSSLYQLPDAEAMTSIGQWGVWVIATQVVLAALISRYHDAAIGSIARACRYVYRKCRGQSGHHEYEHAHQQIQDNQASSTSLDTEVATEYKGNQSASSVMEIPTKPEASPARRSWRSSVTAFVKNVYFTCTSPINQSGKGLVDECRNFFQWCKDPPRVSRRVVRHPIRSSHEETLVFDDLYSKGFPVQAPYDRRESGFFRAATVKRSRGAV